MTTKPLAYSVITPTNRPYSVLKGLLQSMEKQTVGPVMMYIIYDKKLTRNSHQELEKQLKSHKSLASKIELVSNISHPKFKTQKGPSYLRNYGFSLVKTDLVLSVDDDNEFEPDFCEKLVACHQELFGKNPGVVQSLEERGRTGEIRFSGYSKFHPFRVRPTKIPYDPTQTKPYPSAYAPSNCFLGNTVLMKQYPFNEDLVFTYEDFLFFKTLALHGHPVYICPTVRTHHMVEARPKLNELYVATENYAYQKGRNRIIMMRSVGTFREKVIFFTLGIIGQTGWLGLHILALAPRKQKFTLSFALLHGTRDGLFHKAGKR